MISAQIETAVSSGVRAPMSRPIGAMTRTSCSSVTPSAISRSLRSAVVRREPIAPQVADLGVECRNHGGNVELWVVGQHAYGVTSGQLAADTIQHNRFGPVDDDLVGLREALLGSEDGSSIANSDSVANSFAARHSAAVKSTAPNISICGGGANVSTNTETASSRASPLVRSDGCLEVPAPSSPRASRATHAVQVWVAERPCKEPSASTSSLAPGFGPSITATG